MRILQLLLIVDENGLRWLQLNGPKDLIYHDHYEKHCCAVQYAEHVMYFAGLNHVYFLKEDGSLEDHNLMTRYGVGLTDLPRGIGLTCIRRHEDVIVTFRLSKDLKSIDLVKSYKVRKGRRMVDNVVQIAYVPWKSWILVVNAKKCELECYTTCFKHLETRQIPMKIIPRGIHVAQQQYILISGEKTVANFMITSEDKLSLIWKCEGLPSPTGMTSDPAGFIYVGNYESFSIDILSQDGKYME